MVQASPTPEEQARKKINSQLQAVGWNSLGDYIDHQNLDDLTETGYVEELGTNTGPADYGLIIEGDLAAIIESKPAGENAAGHFQQAERYAKSVEGQYSQGDYGIPVAFVATGEETHLYDFRKYSPTSRPIASVHSPQGLRRLVTRDYERAHKWLQSNPAEAIDPDLWVHQKKCIEAIEDSLRSRERRMLVQMATGAGKTRTAMSSTFRLLDSGFADKILFIPDTRKLAEDAYDSFTGYDPTGVDAPFVEKYRIVNLEEEEGSRLDRGEVVITTLQKMYYLLDNEEIEFHPGDFDVIITDECHRSIYQNEGYGSVFQQFDAVEIGLTATPTRQTVSRFGNNLVFEYGYAEAVSDEHVVPFQLYALETRITMSGVFDEETGEFHSPDALGKEVLVPDTHRKVGEELRRRMEDDSELTLIFARNDNHATQIVRDFRETVFSDKPDNYVQKITYKSDRPGDTLNRFSDPHDPSPAIAVTVQMVSTGVDIRPLKNVILLNPVKSPVLFNQMLGRGTRSYGEKTHFNIYDCVGALEYFDGVPPFGTLDFDRPIPSKKPDEDPGISEGDDGPRIVDVPDEVIRSEPVFPTESGERLTADGFREAFRHDVQSIADIIIQRINDESDISSANDALREILEERSQYYVPVFLDKAYEPVIDEGGYLLIDYVNEALTGRLPTFTQRTARARSKLEKIYEFNEVEKEYIELMTAVSEPPNGLSKDDFYDPPLSEIGGWKRATNEFTTITPQELVNEFRDHLCDFIGDVEMNTTHREHAQSNSIDESNHVS